MQELQNELEQKTSGGLSGAYITVGYLGEYDMIGMLANSKEYEKEAGSIIYNNETNKAEFIKDK